MMYIPRTRLDGNVSTVTEAGELFEKIYNEAKEAYPNLTQTAFYKEYPLGKKPQELEVPCITFGIGDKQLANKPKPRPMEERPDPENPGYSIRIDSNRYEAVIRFDVWAASNRYADILTEEFEEFIHTFSGALMGSGLYDIRYLGWAPNDGIVDWKDQVAHRQILYAIGLEKIFESSTKSVEEIVKKIQAKTYLKEDN
jgi:hypothetical protein